MSYLRHLSSAAGAAKRVVIVDGTRIPFALSSTIYKDKMAVDLAQMAIRGLLNKTALDAGSLDYMLWGNVLMEPRTSNIAREASVNAGVPNHVASHTVTQACISANQAICTGAEKILAGQADIVLAGGCETFSDVPIRYSKPVRQRLIAAPKAMKKGAAGVMGLLKGLKLKDLAPEAPQIANFTTGEVMGHSSDRLAAKFGVTRAECDEFALASHQKAAKAHAAGLYDAEITPVGGSTAENGIKGDSTLEKLASLKPAFVKPHGTHTAANSSFLTDGAAATLIMSERKALELGYKPKAYIKSWAFVAVDPFEELLLGPTYASAKALSQAGLELSDVDCLELHEAFAGQVLANIAAMGSDQFARDHLGRSAKVGEVDHAKLNLLGGSLSLGHPFGATGSRLVLTAANRLQRDNQKFALLAACADGGLGHACVLERYDN